MIKKFENFRFTSDLEKLANEFFVDLLDLDGTTISVTKTTRDSMVLFIRGQMENISQVPYLEEMHKIYRDKVIESKKWGYGFITSIYLKPLEAKKIEVIGNFIAFIEGDLKDFYFYFGHPGPGSQFEIFIEMDC